MIRLLLLTVFFISTMFCNAQSQAAMNQDAKNKYLTADKALNAAYQKILKDYSKDAVFIRNIKKAQQLWVQFRDAEMKAKYPDRGAGYYGSVQPMCQYIYLTGLTEERTTKLKVWIDGIEEGDVCAGSVQRKN